MNPEYIRRELIKKQTKQEKRLYRILDELNVEYVKQWPVPYGNSWMFCDCYLPDLGIVIEVDGMHHVLDITKTAEDSARDKYLWDAYEVRVLRYMNSAIMSRSFKKIIKELVNPIKQTKLG